MVTKQLQNFLDDTLALDLIKSSFPISHVAESPSATTLAVLAEGLILNSAKTEILGWAGRTQVWDTYSQLLIVPLTPAPIIRSLDMILEAPLLLEAQITNCARLAFFQLCHIRQLAPYLSHPGLAIGTLAMATSRLDYCNLLYLGLALRLTWKF